VLIVSGLAAAYVRLDSPSDFVSSGYGRLVSLKLIALILVLVIAARIRGRLKENSTATKLLSLELVVMAAAMGIGVAQTSTAPSRTPQDFATAAEELLGWPFPPAPTIGGLLLGWQPEWTMLSLAVIFAGLYTLGLRRLHQNQIRWSKLAATSFYLGIVLVLWTTSSGIAKYAQLTFSAHMVQHMVLSMLAPIFLVLGAPITLALRALPTTNDHNHRTAREWLLAGLHSRYSTLLTHPIVVLVIFTVGLYGVYFTNLFAKLMSGHAGHVFMEVHFLLTGLLFSYVVIGVDPSPRKVPYGARLMLVLLALSLHAFFAIAIMQSKIPIGAEWYSQVQPPWLTSALADTYAGGGVAWALGEIPTLILVVVVAIQWSRDESKTAKRIDRTADRDGDAQREAYNAYLRGLDQRKN
jgi:putative copper resistance protein D